MSDNEQPAVAPADTTEQQTIMSFAAPVITANMMPRPDPSVDRQSAEDWFKIFHAIADSLISIYRSTGQEAVGQQQALATLPSLLNRNQSEKRLATRIIQECKTIKEAQDVVVKTIGNLESECQASTVVFDLK